jgi:hypothetical protein
MFDEGHDRGGTGLLGKALMRAWGGLDFRLKLLRQLIEIYQSKIDEMADTISQEMGAPRSLARKAQAPAGLVLE